MTTTSSSGKAGTDSASHVSSADVSARSGHAAEASSTTTNPLLAGPSQLPHFTAIEPEHVSPALDVLLADADRALAHVTAPDAPLTWEMPTCNSRARTASDSRVETIMPV